VYTLTFLARSLCDIILESWYGQHWEIEHWLFYMPQTKNQGQGPAFGRMLTIADGK
jgi:hypothetical protein